jgi:hypothetical protein
MSSQILQAYAEREAKRRAQKLANMAWRHGRTYATGAVHGFGNYTKTRIGNSIDRLATKHMGNNAESRALAAELKGHVLNHINYGKKMAINRIKKAPPPKLW